MSKKIISWQQYFMGVAKLSAYRSKDPNTQVGACIVSPENNIVGVGYNGLPWGCEDDQFPWAAREGDLYDTKYPYVLTNGIQYSLNTLKLATALETHRSKEARRLLSLAKSSALP